MYGTPLTRLLLWFDSLHFEMKHSEFQDIISSWALVLLISGTGKMFRQSIHCPISNHLQDYLLVALRQQRYFLVAM